MCSFAMHLCARDYLPTLCMMLACSARHLVVLTPHKRPVIDAAWGGWLPCPARGEGSRTGGSGRIARWYSTEPPMDDDVGEGDGEGDDDDDDDDDGDDT